MKAITEYQLKKIVDEFYGVARPEDFKTDVLEFLKTMYPEIKKIKE